MVSGRQGKGKERKGKRMKGKGVKGRRRDDSRCVYVY